MRLKSKPSEFKRSVSLARSSRMVNIVFCLLGLAATAGAAWVFRDSVYNYFVYCCVAVATVFFVLLCAKSVHEFNTAKRIAKNAVYAARPSAPQREFIKSYLVRRGQMIYFTVMLFCLVPQAVALIAMRFIFNNDTYLLFLAGYALLCLMLTFAASRYLAARLSVRYLITAISKDGAMVGSEIIPFSAQKQDMLQLFKFSNYYYLKFFRGGPLGIRWGGHLIFPTDGVLRNGIKGNRDEQIALALGKNDLFETDNLFYESRDYLNDPEETEGEKKPETAPDAPSATSADPPAASAPIPPAASIVPASSLSPSSAPVPSSSLSPEVSRRPEPSDSDVPQNPGKMKKKKKAGAVDDTAGQTTGKTVYRAAASALQEQK